MAASTALIDFDAVYDRDFGLVRYELLRNKTLPKAVYTFPDDYIKFLLLHRFEENPLSVIGYRNPKPYQEDYESKEVIDLASKTLMFNFIKKTQVAGGGQIIDVLIRCSNKLQEEHIKQNLPLIKTYLGPWKDITNDSYDAVYLKSVKSLEEFVTIEGKTIYIQRHVLNFEQDKDSLLQQYTERFNDVNIFRVVDVYADLELPKG